MHAFGALSIVTGTFLIFAPFLHTLLHAVASVVQDSAAVAVGTDTSACIVYAPVIAIVVSLLKRLPFMAKYPKFVAAILSTVAVAFPLLATGGALHTAAIVSCILKTFAGSIATYEVALKPAAKAFGVSVS